MIRALRYLRIAWTVIFGVLCVLLIGLWVHSYWKYDSVRGCYKGRFTNIDCISGVVSVTSISPYPSRLSWQVAQLPIENPAGQMALRLELWKYKHLGPGIWVRAIGRGWQLAISLWLLTLFSGIMAALPAPWIHWQMHFSLRTLLIAMTAVAVVLWFILWMARR